MHIAFLTPEYPHPQLGAAAGIGTSIKNLATAMVEKGHQITVFVFSQVQHEVLFDDGFEIHAIAHQKYRIGGFYLYRKQVQQYINQVVQEKGIQLIEAPDWTGITAFMKFNIPLVIRMHGTDAYFCQLEGRKQKLKNCIFERLALQHADYLVSVSQFTANRTRKLFNLKKPIEVIPNFIDTEVFKPLDMPINNQQLLYFGTLIRKKGVLELACIFNKVVEKEPDVNLLLLGKDVVDIHERKSTVALFEERLSKEALQRVQHVTSVPYLHINEYIASANVVVLPSLAEAFPMTWLEAMAMEKALVTSDIGWANEMMVEGKTGFIVNPYHHELYADRIVKLLNDTELVQLMGKRARQHIENHFSKDLMGAKNEGYYQSILRN